MSSSFQVLTSNFEEVLPIWKERLWPDRKSPIEAANPIQLGGHYNESLFQAKVSFFKIVDNDSSEILGVISGFSTSSFQYRARGIYVDPKIRRAGGGNILMNALMNQAISEDKQVIWSLPRQSALPFYQSMGFVRVSRWFDKEYEFGPNCFAIRSLRSKDQIKEECSRIQKRRIDFYNQHLVGRERTEIQVKLWDLAVEEQELWR